MIQIDGVPDYGRVGHYERKGLYSVEEVMAKVITTITLADFDQSIEPHSPKLVDFDSDPINLNVLRYALFLHNITCVRCSLEGLFYVKERAVYWHKPSGQWWPTSYRYHFGLYGMNLRGDLIMLTKDHVHPKSQGGRDVLSNMQTMCAPCNSRKRDRMPHETDDEYFTRRRKQVEAEASNTNRRDPYHPGKYL